MIRPEVLRRRLAKLDECLVILRRHRRYSLDEFLADPERYGSAERFLQLAIETVNDMGNHVIAADALGVVDHYADIPMLLLQAGHVDAELADAWTRMIGFRNVLVHGYLEIDRSLVYVALTDRLGYLKALRDVFARLL